jgi:hypothetical protein
LIPRWLVPVLLLLPLACARLPAIKPGDGAFSPQTGKALESSRIFPQGTWQFLHSIRGKMPGGRNFVMMGLTIISSRLRTHRSVIMTLEGFVLFDGEYDGGIIVHRALPPFDSPHFAEGLMQDIRLIFFEPEDPVAAVGALKDGSMVRRHRAPDGSTVDIEAQKDGNWRIRRYSPSQRLTREVRAPHAADGPSGFPATIELTACGDYSYSLTMTLLEAVQIEPQNEAGSSAAGFTLN